MAYQRSSSRQYTLVYLCTVFLLTSSIGFVFTSVTLDRYADWQHKAAVRAQRVAEAQRRAKIEAYRQRAAATVPETMKKISDVDVKIGQMLMIGFHGTNKRPVLDAIRKYHVGGVILYTENIQGQNQVKEMIREFQAASRKANYDIPLLIATDEEGGGVERFRAIKPPASCRNEAWGDLYQLREHPQSLDPKKSACQGVELQARLVAKKFHQLGFNMNLAPVLDVLTNDENTVLAKKGRSYGADPQMVAALGGAYIKALQREYVVATAKHFPGHGSTATDSHFDKTIDRTDAETMADLHLHPFDQAIKHAHVEAIMTAHVGFPNAFLSGETPATLAPQVLNDYLRRVLHFDGVIITDSMGMASIRKFYAGNSFALATHAGADILLIGRDESLLPQAYAELKREFERGALSPKRLDESLRRILTLKARYCLPFNEQGEFDYAHEDGGY